MFTGMKYCSVVAFFTVWALIGCAPAQAQDNAANPLGLFMQRNHPATYTPGQSIEIILSIQAGQAGEITAMGLRETAPDGWTLQGVNGLNGAPPDVAPAVGASGLLEFAWITAPALPYSFAYTLSVPEGESGDKMIHGALEYRQMEGAHYAPPVLTSLQGPAPEIPTLTLNGDNPMTITVGATWKEPGYTAVDSKNNDISAKVTVTGTVNTTEVGYYAVTYSVSSSDGHKTASITRVVQVVAASKEEGNTVIPSTGGGAIDPEAATGSRARSNPIAASTSKNAASTQSETKKSSSPGASSLKRPELPDTSPYRPKSPASGNEKTPDFTKSKKGKKSSRADYLEEKIQAAQQKFFANTAPIPVGSHNHSPMEKIEASSNEAPSSVDTAAASQKPAPLERMKTILPFLIAGVTMLFLLILFVLLIFWISGRTTNRKVKRKS